MPPLPNGHIYTIYMDNLFTSTALFRLLREAGFGVCGTTRPHYSPDFPPKLRAIKDYYSDKLPWGTIVAVAVDRVLCIAWINNNAVLALSTVHTVNQVHDVILKWRKRPAPTSTNAINARKPFEGRGARAELEIPRFINDYNYNMGGVDIADQHRAAFKTQRKALRNWLPHWYWILDHTIINAFKLGRYAPGGFWTKKDHRDFRIQLYQQLFEFKLKGEKAKQATLLGTQRLEQPQQHTYAKLSPNRYPCAWCSHEKDVARSMSRTPSPKKRCFGDEIDPNIATNIPTGRCKRTMFGCVECGVFLCGFD